MTVGQHGDSHRVVVEFDDGVYTPRLIHPECGCQTATTCGHCGRALDDQETKPCYDCEGITEPQECWVQGWFDNAGADELLKGKLVLTVDPEWTGDGCLLHITGAAMWEGSPHA